MITSLGDKQHIMRAVEAGVSDYLGKPFTAEELTRKVHKALKKAGKLPSDAGPASSPQGGGAFSSAELLNTGRSDSMVPTPSADALTGARKTGSAKVRATGILQGGEQQYKCMIKNISLEEALAVIKADAGHPELLSSLELTLADTGGDQRIGPIRTWVHGVSALEKRRDPDFFHVQLRLDDNPDTMVDELTEFIRQSGG